MITKDEVNNIIYKNGVVYINDLVEQQDRDNFIQTIDLLHKIEINNKKVKVKVYCKECNKELVVRPSQYKKQKNFHCEEHIFHRPSGEQSPFYNRINVSCTNCGKVYSVVHSDYNKKNRLGDNHNFCCQKCYWEFRSKYYIDDKHHMFGTHLSEESKNAQRELAIKMISDGRMPQTMSKPHKKIYDLLVFNNISVENEHPLKYHSIDIFLKEYNLMIEIMGDYWHAIPTKYDVTKLTEQQKKSIKQDKSKRSYVKKYENVDILYIWEKDINSNIELCLKIILEYINNRGKLDNYHSYNYHMDDDILVLNDILITPFQEYTQSVTQLCVS